jgi:hypothetical protein
MPLVPDGSDLCKDRDRATPAKKGGSRSYRPFELYSAVIPGDAKHRTRNLEIPGLVLRTIPE